MVEQYDIDIIPINFYAGGKLYRDWVDITPSEAYELFLQDPDSFKTSAASPEDCLNAFRNASQKAENILCVTVSAGLSMMYEAALEARKLAEKELPQTSIVIMDSRMATPAEGLVALSAARVAEEGRELEEVIRAADKVKSKVNVVVILDTIRHVLPLRAHTQDSIANRFRTEHQTDSHYFRCRAFFRRNQKHETGRGTPD